MPHGVFVLLKNFIEQSLIETEVWWLEMIWGKSIDIVN